MDHECFQSGFEAADNELGLGEPSLPMYGSGSHTGAWESKGDGFMKRLLVLGVKGVAIMGLLVTSMAFSKEAPREYQGMCWWDDIYSDWACAIGCPPGLCDCDFNAQCP
jgi:hypothetical protein